MWKIFTNRYARGVAVLKNKHVLIKWVLRFSASNIFYMWKSAFGHGTLIPLHSFHKQFCPYTSRFVLPKQLWIFVQSLYNGTCGNSPALFEITSKRTAFRLRNRPLSLNLTSLMVNIRKYFPLQYDKVIHKLSFYILRKLSIFSFFINIVNNKIAYNTVVLWILRYYRTEFR